MSPTTRLLACAAALSLASLGAQAQSSPATPPSTMPQPAPSYEPTDAFPDAVNDAAIETSLSTAFDHDSELAPLKINVDASEGNVSLHGIVPNDELRDRAVALAANVRGVKTLESDLIVQGSPQP